MKFPAAILLFFALVSCQSGPPTVEEIQDVLAQPENIQEFAYADFGPPLLTYHTLGDPKPFGEVAEEREAGWPVETSGSWLWRRVISSRR